LIEEQVRLANENGGKPVKISIERREELLKQADTIVYVGRVDPKKIGEAWEKASRGGRGPIGGALDD
jgi:hypothetical protein